MKKYKSIEGGIIDTTTNEEYLEEEDILELLNRLDEKNNRLQWELQKTREELDFFANLKINAMKGPTQE